MTYRYLKNAPPSLVRLHQRLLVAEGGWLTFAENDDGRFVPLGELPRPMSEQSSPRSPSSILERLLCNKQMARTWTQFESKKVDVQFYETLFRTIIRALGVARRGVIAQTDLREKYNCIARAAEWLTELIEDPANDPSHANSKYRPELNLVAEVLDEQWPAFVERLKILTIRSRQEATAPLPKRRRSRKRTEDTDGETILRTKIRLFACHLDNELYKLTGRKQYPSNIRAIAVAVYGEDFDVELKKAIYDHRAERNLI